MTSSVLRAVAHHPVVAFMVIGLVAAFSGGCDSTDCGRPDLAVRPPAVTEWSAAFSASASAPSSSPTRCPGAPGWPTSRDAACGGGSRCAGT